MDTNGELRIRSTLRHIIDLIVAGDYEGVEALSKGVRLRADHIRSGNEEYGRRVVTPPATAYDQLDVVEVENKLLPTYSVFFRLFTSEEGESDLELQVTLIDEDPNAPEMTVEIDNILVP